MTDRRADEVPVIAMRCDLVVELGTVIPHDHPVALVMASDVPDRDMLVVVE
jgi:hypothetical protein